MKTAISDIDRFMEKVQKTSNCWIWTAYKNRHGYGQFAVDRKPVAAHRWIYEYYFGPLMDSYCLHRCNNTSCVNPLHLEAGTQSDNMMHCASSGRHMNSRKSHCNKGHLLTGVDVRGDRYCMTCNRFRMYAERLQKKLPVLRVGIRTPI